MTRAIYFTNKPTPDLAVARGLQAAGCELVQSRTITETLTHLNNAAGASIYVVLIADLQAGAIPLLTLLAEQGRSVPSLWPSTDGLAAAIPPAMIVDNEGTHVGSVIRALQLGVREYVLVSSRESEREMAARLLVERSQCMESFSRTPLPAMAVMSNGNGNGHVSQPHTNGNGTAAAAPTRFVWIPKENVIRCSDGDVFVSQTEGRIFDVLVKYQGQVVTVAELMDQALKCADVDMELGVARLRTHMMRLRQKLQAHTTMANRIVNVRGSGYMLV
jgi:DNA-binding response OmpR family regulator